MISPVKFSTATASLCLLILVLSCKTSQHNQSTKVKGVWQAQPIIVDGNSKDWPSPYPSYDAKAMIGYAYSNDNNNLYLTIETGDEMTQMKILREGLTVWIDTGGGKNKATAIRFPQENDDEELKMQRSPQGQQQEQGKRLLADRIKKGVANVNQYSLQGFSACNGNYMLKQANKCGITVAMAMDEYNELIWEAAIPLKAIFNKELGKKDKGRPISVCFALKGIKKPVTKSGGEHNGGGGGGMRGGGGMGGGGGMRGGGMRGGGMHGGGGNNSNTSDREHLYESTNTWRQFGLELNP